MVSLAPIHDGEQARQEGSSRAAFLGVVLGVRARAGTCVSGLWVGRVVGPTGSLAVVGSAAESAVLHYSFASVTPLDDVVNLA